MLWKTHSFDCKLQNSSFTQFIGCPYKNHTRNQQAKIPKPPVFGYFGLWPVGAVEGFMTGVATGMMMGTVKMDSKKWLACLNLQTKLPTDW